jgi:hypothetical protein
MSADQPGLVGNRTITFLDKEGAMISVHTPDAMGGIRAVFPAPAHGGGDPDRRMEQPLPPGVRRLMLSFPLAWALHDLEEVLTMGAWSGRTAERIRERFPWIPRPLVEAVDTTPAQAAVAVGVIGGIVTWSSVRALRARSVDTGLFLPALAAYTGHAFTHLAESAAAGGYTPGVITCPVVVLPYSAWAWRTLRHAGLADRQRVLRAARRGMALTLPSILGAQGLARLLVKVRAGG